MTIPDICPGHGEANDPRPEFGGRTARQQAENEEMAAISLGGLAVICALAGLFAFVMAILEIVGGSKW